MAFALTRDTLLCPDNQRELLTATRYTPLAGSIVMDLSKMQPSGIR